MFKLAESENLYEVDVPALLPKIKVIAKGFDEKGFSLRNDINTTQAQFLSRHKAMVAEDLLQKGREASKIQNIDYLS